METKNPKYGKKLCTTCAKWFYVTLKDFKDRSRTRCNQCRMQEPLFIEETQPRKVR